MTAAAFIGVLPGTGWVLERIDANGARTVLPAIGFVVTAAGEVLALPLSLGPEWSWRPSVGAQDDQRIKEYAAALIKWPAMGPFGLITEPEIDDGTRKRRW